MGDSIVKRHEDKHKERYKYEIDVYTGFHLHGKEQNKKSLYLDFHLLRKLQE